METENKYDFHAPSEHWEGHSMSINIFQWVPSKSGKGVKQNKGFLRIRGYNRAALIAMGHRICTMLNTGVLDRSQLLIKSTTIENIEKYLAP